MSGAEVEHNRLRGYNILIKEKMLYIDPPTQSKALASCAQIRGQAKGVTLAEAARLVREAIVSTISSFNPRLVLRGLVVEEQEIQSEASDL